MKDWEFVESTHIVLAGINHPNNTRKAIKARKFPMCFIRHRKVVCLSKHLFLITCLHNLSIHNLYQPTVTKLFLIQISNAQCVTVYDI